MLHSNRIKWSKPEHLMVIQYYYLVHFQIFLIVLKMFFIAFFSLIRGVGRLEIGKLCWITYCNKLSSLSLSFFNAHNVMSLCFDMQTLYIINIYNLMNLEKACTREAITTIYGINLSINSQSSLPPLIYYYYYFCDKNT